MLTQEKVPFSRWVCIACLIDHRALPCISVCFCFNSTELLLGVLNGLISIFPQKLNALNFAVCVCLWVSIAVKVVLVTGFSMTGLLVRIA